MEHNADQAQNPASSHSSATPARPDNRYENRDIPLELIDEPSLPIRETMEEEELANGALSVMAIGLINPLSVFAKADGRYEVIAGHRRLLECRLANYSPVPCRVYVGSAIDPLAILVAENTNREDVNPVHEGRWFWRIYNERAGQDVDRLCEIVQRRRQYVEARMLLVQYPPRVVEALERKKISIAVADELAKVRDPGRLILLLDVAIQSGATAKMVTQWRREGAELGDVQIPPASAETSTSSGSDAGGGFRMECLFCEESDHPELMEMLYVHKTCKKMLDRILHRSPADTVGSGQ